MKPTFMKQDGEPVLIAQGEANFKRFGAVLNGQLEGKRFVTGDELTIADLALSSILTYRQPAKMDLEAWLARGPVGRVRRGLRLRGRARGVTPSLARLM